MVAVHPYSAFFFLTGIHPVWVDALSNFEGYLMYNLFILSLNALVILAVFCALYIALKKLISVIFTPRQFYKRLLIRFNFKEDETSSRRKYLDMIHIAHSNIAKSEKPNGLKSLPLQEDIDYSVYDRPTFIRKNIVMH